MAMHYYTTVPTVNPTLVCSDCGAVMAFYRAPAPRYFAI